MACVGPPGCCTGLHGPEASHASEFAASAAAAAPEGGGDAAGAEDGSGRKLPRSALHRGALRRMAVRRMAGLVCLLIFWVLVGMLPKERRGRVFIV